MPYLEFEGPQQLPDAVDAALTFYYSAVIVYGAVPYARRNLRQRALGKPVELLYATVPQLSTVDRRIREWAGFLSLEQYDGLGLGFEQRGTDGPQRLNRNISPFWLSVGLDGSADWRTQSEFFFDQARTDPQFDPDRPIDSFRQGGSDLVIVPAFPLPSTAEVRGDNDYVSQIYTTHAR